jgi:hypothetical protein
VLASVEWALSARRPSDFTMATVGDAFVPTIDRHHPAHFVVHVVFDCSSFGIVRDCKRKSGPNLAVLGLLTNR